MLCYKGQTFCSQKCGNTECPRNLTDAVIADARKWWGGCYKDPPIDIADLKTDTCGYLPKEQP